MTPPLPVSRRALLALAAAGGGAATPIAASPPPADTCVADLQRYVGFGGKASGGPGDEACGAWLEAEAVRAGYAVRRHPIEVPWFEPSTAMLAAGAASAEVIPQGVVTPTGPGGVEGPLVIRQAWTAPAAPCLGAIALLVLPHSRWSTATAPGLRRAVDEAFAGGAAAVVLVTTGPTGEAIALNAPPDRPLFRGPVASLAPRQAAPLLAAAERGAHGHLVIDGRGGRRRAWNLLARLDRGAGRTLAVSTPRSGWFACGGERGPGVAVWLALLRWAPAALTGHDLVFLATSGHEYENMGGEAFLTSPLAPRPAATDLWVHLGANVAGRDWNELGPLTPLSSPDPQRILMVSPPLAARARGAFTGQPGLQDVRETAPGASAGELTGILAAGYGAVAGVFGAHRFHHTRADDLRRADPQSTMAAAMGFKSLILASLTAS
ncbi:hypothetical protein ACO2Q3_09795 [Caulobacter sp. KR2-114]|uniref:hypothetical protein n=1 Tax=Caulobacter sp. KR2-114 TaxID=3400912 RepID=UPI003C053FD7